jgi:hypothetical protein
LAGPQQHRASSNAQVFEVPRVYACSHRLTICSHDPVPALPLAQAGSVPVTGGSCRGLWHRQLLAVEACPGWEAGRTRLSHSALSSTQLGGVVDWFVHVLGSAPPPCTLPRGRCGCSIAAEGSHCMPLLCLPPCLLAARWHPATRAAAPACFLGAGVLVQRRAQQPPTAEYMYLNTCIHVLEYSSGWWLLQVMALMKMEKGGPALGQLMDRVVDWQLCHPSGSPDDCREYLLANFSGTADMHQ